MLVGPLDSTVKYFNKLTWPRAETKSYRYNRKAIDRTEKIKDKTPIFVAKTRIYDIFVAKIYDYVLIDNF